MTSIINLKKIFIKIVSFLLTCCAVQTTEKLSSSKELLEQDKYPETSNIFPTPSSRIIESNSYPTNNHIDNPSQPFDDIDQPALSPTLLRSSPTEEKKDYDIYAKLLTNKFESIKIKEIDFYDLTKDKNDKCNEATLSPINIRKDEGCHDDHQIFTNRGLQDFSTIDFAIEPSSLRAYLKVESLSQSATADPSNLAELSKAIFVDVKIPAEHTWRGNEYAGELQIVHHWDHTEGRFIILSVLLDDSDDITNKPLEMFIREWEEEAKREEYICNDAKGINFTDYKPYFPLYERPTKEEMKNTWGICSPHEECTDGQAADWDVYRFIPTFWYCGYDEGSLTVSPCTDNTYWRIFDLPLKISKSQTKRMTNLLVNQIHHDDCTSSNNYTAYNKTLTFSRPIQEKRDSQSVYCCKSDDFMVEAKDHQYWENLWPRDYHGWKGWKP